MAMPALLKHLPPDLEVYGKGVHACLSACAAHGRRMTPPAATARDRRPSPSDVPMRL